MRLTNPASLAMCFVLFASNVAEADRPSGDTPLNVLFIAVDDMRAELGCYGSPIVQSPNLDALAEQSLLFERAYCQQAVCNPSRASLLTGLRVDTLGIYDLPTHFRQRFPDIVTLPQMFKQHGYQTYDIGKIFHNYRQDEWRGDAVSWSGEQVLHYGSHGDDQAVVAGSPPLDQISLPRAEKLAVADDAYWDGQIAAAAITKLQQLKDQPFFLGVGFWKPHLPFNAPAKYWELYDAAEVALPANPQPPVNGPSIALHESRELKRGYPDGLSADQVKALRHGYYAAISYVDAQIGKVLDELERLELRDKTIVVFWSDHGFHLGEHDLWCKNSNFELDARVPMMIAVPGQTTAGKRTQSLVELLDIYPTLADLCGLQQPHTLEGLSLRPILEDETATVRNYALTQNPRPATGESSEQPIMGYSIRSTTHRYTQWRDRASGEIIASELYDHALDPLETQNIVDDPEALPVIARHAAYLNQAAPLPKLEHRPNVCFILVDDLGWADLGCQGHPWHRTPNIDRLAAQGMRFTNAYSPAPICSAARASILTGKAVPRVGLEFVTKNAPGRQKLDAPQPLEAPPIVVNLPLKELTIAEQLNELDYQTAFFGKWHVSQHYQQRYLAWHPLYGPQQQGFQFAVEDFGDHPYAWSKRTPPDAAQGVFPVDSLFTQANDFIGGQHERPFFMMASLYYVHTPVENRCRWLVEQYDGIIPDDVVKRERRLEYAAFVETMDHHVGSLLDAIDNAGLADDTLVVLMSDNGGHPEYTANAPLRGSKWNLYEGGIRVPFIARWPRKIAAASTSDTPVIGYDLLPTFVALAGGETPETDGANLIPLLKGEEFETERDLVWHFPYYHPETSFSTSLPEIGVNDFAISQTRPQSALRSGQYKLITFAEDERMELYDLQHDVSESHDLRNEQPVLADQLYQRLQQTLDAMHARRAVPRESKANAVPTK